MKRRTVLGFTSLLFLASTSTLAITSQSTDANYDQDINKLSVKAESLETRVKALNADIAQLKQEKIRAQAARATLQQEIEANRRTSEENKERIEMNREEILQTEIRQAVIHGLPMPHQTGGPVALSKLASSIYTLGPTVTTSPYLGIRSAFDASDLLTSLPSMNEDLRILQQRQELTSRLKSLGQVPIYENRPVLEFSGQLAAQGIYTRPYEGSNTSDIDLTAAELDTLMLVSDWALAFMSIQYDNSQSPYTAAPGDRVSNSRFYLTRGFLTIGDLDKFPIYLTAGQMFVPFGNYSSYAITDPLTKSLARTNQRAALLGFADHGIYAQAYTFKGPSNVSAPGINQGGFNAGYKWTGAKLSTDVGAGYILNMADSSRMQNTGAPPFSSFQGFAVPPGGDPDSYPSSINEHLEHRVPGVDVHGSAAYGPVTLIGEYVGATRDFDASNLTYNGHGAQPKAMQLEGVYAFNIVQRPTNITLSYDRSWQALALNLPQHSLLGAVNISIWKDTVESLEFRHDINYSSSDISSGNGAPVPVNSAGSYQNTVTAQLAVYF